MLQRLPSYDHAGSKQFKAQWRETQGCRERTNVTRHVLSGCSGCASCLLSTLGVASDISDLFRVSWQGVFVWISQSWSMVGAMMMAAERVANLAR